MKEDNFEIRIMKPRKQKLTWVRKIKSFLQMIKTEILSSKDLLWDNYSRTYNSKTKWIWEGERHEMQETCKQKLFNPNLKCN